MNKTADEGTRTTVAALQEEIRRHHSGESVSNRQKARLTSVARHQYVNSHLPIGWPTMPKGVGPKAIAYAKKLVRRLLRWYIDPIVEQQNAFNAAVTDLLTDLERRTLELEQLSVAIQPTSQPSEDFGDRCHMATLDRPGE